MPEDKRKFMGVPIYVIEAMLEIQGSVDQGSAFKVIQAIQRMKKDSAARNWMIKHHKRYLDVLIAMYEYKPKAAISYGYFD